MLNKERIEFWLVSSAVASDTVAEIIKEKLQLISPQYEAKVARRARARKIARKKGLPFTKAERASLSGGEEKKAE